MTLYRDASQPVADRVADLMCLRQYFIYKIFYRKTIK